jgi:hypothetical protein
MRWAIGGVALTVALLLPTANAGAQAGPSCLAGTGPNFEQEFLALDNSRCRADDLLPVSRAGCLTRAATP